MRVNFKRLIPEAIIPTRNDSGSAGYDLYIPDLLEYGHLIMPGETHKCRLGFAIEGARFETKPLVDDDVLNAIPEGNIKDTLSKYEFFRTEKVLIDHTNGMNYMFLILPRSGNALKKQLGVLNSPGLVDSSYRGEMCVILHNHSQRPIEILPRDKIAQMVLTPYFPMEFVEVDELGQTERGENGFGSSGVVSG